MVTEKFRVAYKNLNPEQKKAVDEIEGPVMVVAGPGTGKTQILILRIANILLKTHINPENILALTFTESAAREMQKRLVDLIGTPGFRVEIFTFHGFCNSIIQNYPEEFSHLISSKPIIEVEQVQILEDLIMRLKLDILKPFGEPLYYLKSLLSEINNLKKEGINPEDLEKAINGQKKDYEKIQDLRYEKGKYKGEIKGSYLQLKKDILKNEELLNIFDLYQKELLKQKKYDFNDMLLEVKKALLKNTFLKLILQEKYQYFLIDEHQDTNNVQNKILEILGDFFENPNIFVVGDEKQAIFRFQGASIENFLYFKKLYPKAKIINLEKNYRSDQLILDASESLISKNITSGLLNQNTKLKAQNTGLGKIKLGEFQDFFAEYQFIALEIQNMKDKTKVCVIARNNKDLINVANALEQKGILYSLHSDQNLLSDPYIQKLILIFQAIENVGSERNLLKIMHLDLFNIEPFNLYKLVNFARINRISVHELISDKTNLQKLKIKNPNRFIDFFNKLNIWQKLKDNENLESLFVRILNESGLRSKILSSPKRYELLDKFISLFEQVKKLVSDNKDFSLADFLNYIDLCQKHEIALKINTQTMPSNAVNLITAHRAKGLEFDYVYIINVFDGHFGNSKRRNKGFKIPWDKLSIRLNLDYGENEDERRLFFVAITRARKSVTFTYSTKSLEGMEQIPSQFIEEVDPNLIEKIDTKKYEKNFLLNKDIIFAPKITNILPAKNKEFLNQIFWERGLSVTGLENYLSCPWKFFYRNLLLFPDVKSKHMIYGTAVHFALDNYIKKYKTKKLTERFLIEKFVESLNKEDLNQDVVEELTEKGKIALTGYFQNVILNWGKNIQSEMRIKGIKLKEGVILNGRLDMIEQTGNLNEVRVYDFKTGRVKTRSQIDGTNKKDLSNYLRQLTFYKILLDNYKNGLLKMTEGVIDFVESDAKGNFHQEIFKISETEVENLKKIIFQVCDEIINLSFWERRCEDLKCEYCKLREIMG